MSDSDVFLFTEVASHVVEIDFEGASVTNQAILSLIKHCSQAMKVTAGKQSTFSAAHFLRLSEHSTALVDLSLGFITLNRAQFRAILSNSPHIKAINMISVMGLATVDALEELGETCSQLLSLAVGHFMQNTQYPVLATKFKKLKKIHLAARREVFLDGMFLMCTPLEELHLSQVYLHDDTLCRILQVSPDLQVFRNPRQVDCKLLLQNIAMCSQLKVLDFACHGTGIDSAMALVAEKCTQLESLTIQHAFNSSETALTAIATHCVSNLRKFSLIGCECIAAERIIDVVRQCTHLTHLHLSQFSISSSMLCDMVSHCSQLISLKLTNYFMDLDDTVAVAVCTHAARRLQEFHLEGSWGSVSDDCIARLLRSCTALRSLRVVSYFLVDCVLHASLVKIIDQSCARLTEFRVGCCSPAVYKALTELKARRAEKKIEFTFSATVLYAPCSCCACHCCCRQYVCIC